MKKYQKAEVIAKNLTTGSYAAGCPGNTGDRRWPGDDKSMRCRNCEVAM